MTTSGARYGLVEDGIVFELVGNNPFAEHLEKGDAMGEFEHLLLAPPIVPSKIIAVGRNYAAHAAEMDNPLPEEPMLFLKPPSALIAFDIPIQLPPNIGRIDQEAELAVVIGKTAKKVTVNHALDYVLGYTCGNDVSARVLQKKDGQWGRAKGFDTFNPLGPWIETDIENPNNLAIEARINGQTVQKSNTSYMVFDVPTLIAFISSIMTLNAGDIIMTGTPEGVSELHDGDVVEIEIEQIGILRNPVEKLS
ncbi:MAG: FAA hydrolase family protein [Chloroflexi bacterium]|nr:MAG: FAA hydrolase family protein [Chloroflexota bacterium]